MYDLLYRLLRWIGAHVQGFYKAVGVFLIIGLMVVLVAAVGFATLAERVMAGDTLHMDETILRAMERMGAPWLDNVALEVTALGARVVVWMVVLIASVFLWSSRHHYSAALLWVSMLGAGFVNAALKVSFNRPRPDVFPWRTQHVGLASFPSGHAMTSIVVYGTLAFLIARLAPTRLLRRLTWMLAILVILLIGWSRLYLGVHWPSDVLAGFVMGAAWAVICGLGIEAVRYFRTRRPMVVVEEKDLDTKGPVAPPNPA
ncbi:MAG TPA: phosphatase PAP2 family protein [Longimicrobium sp.]